tara:strand:+ start:5905 stop:7050 length:1146 start_codon:yes stop_codon:yes gene_type:complete
MSIDDKFFDASKLGEMAKRPNAGLKEVEANAGNLFYADGSDALANDGLTISFEHVPSSRMVHFKAFIQAFNESYNSDWAEESVFGRSDPIRMFKQTTRSITLSFIIPAATTGEGYENLAKVQKLVSFLYPNYSDIGNALTISQSPLIRLKLMNLISNNMDNNVATQGDLNALTLGLANSTSGLLGAITNVAINHNLDNPDYGVFHIASGTVIPKAIEVTIDFKALHENNLGWSDDEKGNVNFADELFPYGTDLVSSLKQSGRGNKESLLAAQHEEAAGYTEGIRQQRQEEADERTLQAAKDLAQAKLLKADGTLNKRGQRLQRRLKKGKVKNSEKAAAYAGALRSTEKGATGANVRQASIDAYSTAEEARAERQDRWSWIK